MTILPIMIAGAIMPSMTTEIWTAIANWCGWAPLADYALSMGLPLALGVLVIVPGGLICRWLELRKGVMP